MIPDNITIREPGLEEITTSISHLNNNKASGEDGHCTFPQEIRLKKKCGVISKIFNEKLKPLVDSALGEYQYRFSSNSSTKTKFLP